MRKCVAVVVVVVRVESGGKETDLASAPIWPFGRICQLSDFGRNICQGSVNSINQKESFKATGKLLDRLVLTLKERKPRPNLMDCDLLPVLE